MVKLDTQIELDVKGFLKWWFEELSRLVPVWIRRMVVDTRDYLLVSKPDEFYDLRLVADQTKDEFGRIVLNEEGRQIWYRLVSRKPNLQQAEIVFRLLPGQALQKVITLPAAALENMRQVAGFEMERLTPFKAKQVYYDVKLIEKVKETNQIKAELLLVPRTKLDAMLKEMVGLGLLPSRVDVGGHLDQDQKRPTLKCNLLPQQLHDQPNRLKRIVNGFLILLALGIIVLIAVLPIWMKQQYSIELEREVEQTSRAAGEVQALKKDAEDLLRDTDFLLKKKSKEPVVVELINELSTRIPDNTWLTNINYRQRKLQLNGQSPSASALIEIIEASPLFENASFVSPVNQDRNTGLERFQIATDVVSRGEVDKSAE